MKRLLASVLLGTLCLWGHAEAREAAASANGADIVLPTQPYKMFPQDWDAYAGRYYLSNGETMTLRRRGLRMYAELANRPPVQLVAAAENVFVAVDRRLKMTFVDDGPDRISADVVMTAPRRQ